MRIIAGFFTHNGFRDVVLGVFDGFFKADGEEFSVDNFKDLPLGVYLVAALVRVDKAAGIIFVGSPCSVKVETVEGVHFRFKVNDVEEYLRSFLSRVGQSR